MLFSGPIFGSFFGILLITEDESLDSVLFFTALLRREQSLKMCFFGHFDHFGVQIEAKSGSKIGTKIWGRCAAIFGSFWSLKTKILILYCFLQHFCAVSDHPRRLCYKVVPDSVGHFGAQNWPENQQKGVIFGTIFWILFLDPFDHWRRKSWFCIVFYSTFAPWAIFENVFFVVLWIILGSSLEPKIGLTINKKVFFSGPFFGSFFGILLITQDENLDSVLFFTALLRRERPPTNAVL